MGESFQDYSGIPEFEADFPRKVSHKIPNSTENTCMLSNLLLVHLKIIDNLNLKSLLLYRPYNASFKILVSKVKD